MNSSEQVPSDEWAAVEHMWEDVARAWFKPDGEGSTFLFQVPRERFQTDDPNPPLTVDHLLNAASISADEVESWHLEDVDEIPPDLSHPLPPPPPDAAHLTVYVRVKPPAPPALPGDDGDLEMTLEKWQALDACWKNILALEASIDAVRMSMDGLRTEMEGAFKQSMNAEEKTNALQSDVSQWTKAKSRVHYALPKVREFIHRATWAAAATERKALEDVVRDYIEPRVLPPDMQQVRERLDHLLKDRQVLLAQGNAVGQDCRGIAAEIHRALATLQRNAADRARKQREARRTKGKYL